MCLVLRWTYLYLFTHRAGQSTTMNKSEGKHFCVITHDSKRSFLSINLKDRITQCWNTT
jgi:hypothetical protein